MNRQQSMISERIERVRQRIAKAARSSQREPASVCLLAVSKTRSIEEVRLALAAGCDCFGESYVQDALPKIAAIGSKSQPISSYANLPTPEWHFIGPLQSNKTASVATHFDWVHSIEREKIALRLNQQRDPNQAPLNVCLQVNISGEASKSGIEPKQAVQLAKTIAGLPRLRLRGLMTIPPRDADEQTTRTVFNRLRALFESICTLGIPLDTLSMGMSKDLEIAIEEGATLVRIGTDIFGPRQQG